RGCINALAVSVVCSKGETVAHPATHIDVERMADAVSRRIVVSVKRVETQVRRKHAGASDRDGGALQVGASQGIRNIAGHIGTLRFQLIDEIHITRVYVDEWKEKVSSFVTYVGYLNDGISKCLKLKCQVPVLRVRHLSTSTRSAGCVTRNSQALQKNQPVCIRAQ